MFWQNYTRIEDFGNDDWDYQDYERNFQDFFDFEGVFFFLLGILGGVLAVVLGLVIVQQCRICIDWIIHTRRTLSRPPSYNTVAKPPRYSICGLTPASPTSPSHYSNQDYGGFPDPPSYSQIHVDRVEQSSSNSQSRPCPNLLDEAERGEAQAIVNVLNLSQNTISDMESVTDHCCGCEGRQSPCPGGESSKMPQRRLTSAKSLFTFDNSRSKFFLCKGGNHKKSFSLQRFRATGPSESGGVSSSSDDISAPLIDDSVDV